MNAVITIGHSQFVLPQKSAMAVLQAMAGALQVSRAFRRDIDPDNGIEIDPKDWREHYTIDGQPCLPEFKLIQDDQLHSPAGQSVTLRPTRGGRRGELPVMPSRLLLGQGGAR